MCNPFRMCTSHLRHRHALSRGSFNNRTWQEPSLPIPWKAGPTAGRGIWINRHACINDIPRGQQDRVQCTACSFMKRMHRPCPMTRGPSRRRRRHVYFHSWQLLIRAIIPVAAGLGVGVVAGNGPEWRFRWVSIFLFSWYVMQVFLAYAAVAVDCIIHRW